MEGPRCQSGSVSDATLPWLVQGSPLQRYVVMIVKYPHRLDKHGRSLELSNWMMGHSIARVHYTFLASLQLLATLSESGSFGD